mgnify:CR=1 FL=1
MKKNLLAVLFSALALTVFTSCGNGDEGSKAPTSCKIILYAGEGSMTNGDEGSTKRKTYTVPYETELTIDTASALGLSYDGHYFLGWAKTNGASAADFIDGCTLNVTSNLTVYAVWQAEATETYYISATGNDTTGSGSVSAPYASLSKAVENVTSQYIEYEFVVSGKVLSDTISFADTQSVWVNASKITIRGATDENTDSLVSNGNGAIFDIRTKVPVLIKNLTLSGGTGVTSAFGKEGGALYVSRGSEDSSSVELSSVIFSANSAAYGGGI